MKLVSVLVNTAKEQDSKMKAQENRLDRQRSWCLN